MKQKILSFLAVVLLMAAGVQSAWAQKVLVVLDNDEVVTYKVQKVKCIMFEEATPEEHVGVDLGLPSGTLWATCNIGADSPEDYGSYFAWGDLETKGSYSWGNYQWMTKGKADWQYISKYTFADNQTAGCWYSGDTFIGDNKTELEFADDAAFQLWGSQWRTPSKEQFDELINSAYTTIEWTAQDGVTGCKITSRSNGESIFLPATGYFGSSGVSNTETGGHYWTRKLDTSYSDRAYELFIRAEGAYCTFSDRYVGLCIRPVRKGHDYVDLGLPSGTLWATCNVGADSPEEYGDYFAWGEIEPKESYTWETYKWCEGTAETLTKYCVNSEYGYKGFTDGKTELDPEDDAATVNMGAAWRMPSAEQTKELIDNCSHEWTQLNGVNGFLVTGPNGSQIFLPAAGNRWQENLFGVGSLFYYWHNAFYPDDNYVHFYASCLGFWADDVLSRDAGLPVRAVRKK